MSEKDKRSPYRWADFDRLAHSRQRGDAVVIAYDLTEGTAAAEVGSIFIIGGSPLTITDLGRRDGWVVQNIMLPGQHYKNGKPVKAPSDLSVRDYTIYAGWAGWLQERGFDRKTFKTPDAARLALEQALDADPPRFTGEYGLRENVSSSVTSN